MSIYSEAQDLISYMTLIKNIDSDPSYYPPRTILQGVYASRLYKILEYIAVQHDDQKSLISFTVKILKVLKPYFQTGIGDEMVVMYTEEGYDPTLQIYKEEEQVGFIDLPSYTFYYQEPQEVSNAKKEISKNLNNIKRLESKKRRIISDYDYKTKDGVEKAIAYIVRKNNMKQANIEIAEVDRKIHKLQTKIVELQDNLSKAEQKNNERILDIQKIERFLSQEIGMNSVPIELTEEQSAQKGDN